MAVGFDFLNSSEVTEDSSWLIEITDNRSSADTTFKQYTEYDVALWLNRYAPWIVLIVALLGNGASVVTVIKMKTLTSVALFVSYLGITDTLYIVFSFMYTALTRYKVSLGNDGCKVIIFLMNYVQVIANWTVVVMTVERFVAVYFPLKISLVFNLKTSIFTLVGKGCFLVVPSCFVLWVYTEVWLDDTTTECAPAPGLENAAKIMRWFDLALISLLPCLLLIFLNGGIIKQLNKTAKVRRNVINAHLLRNKSDKADTEVRARAASSHTALSLMLVTVSVTFIILQLPITLFYIIDRYQPAPTEGRALAVYYLLIEIVHTLNECNHAVNFLLYFLSGRKFRQKFLDVFGFRRILKRVRIRETRANNNLTSQVQSQLDTQQTKLANQEMSFDSQGSATLKILAIQL